MDADDGLSALDAFAAPAAAELPPAPAGGAGGALLASGSAPDRRALTIVWPAYLEASYTEAQGRRVARAAAAGCDGVTVLDVLDAGVALGFPPGTLWLEGAKRYPRADFPLREQNPGRARFWLRARAGGAPTVPGIETKAQLLAALARTIPPLASRAARRAHAAAQHAAMVQHMQAQEAAAAAARGGRAPPPPPQPPAPSPAAGKGRRK